MPKPSVTVLMATYNVEKYVAEAVDSIVSQTFKDFELLIIDDGSQDSTPEILGQYDDERIRIIRTENRGLTSALNTGLQAASGQFIARMDSDDICYRKRLECQMRAIQADKNLALVGSWYEIIDEDGKFLATRNPPTSDENLKASLLTHNPFCHGSVLFRKDAVESLGGYRAEFKASQDYDLWLRLSERYSMTVVPKPLYSWRLRKSGVGASARMLQRAYSKAARQSYEQRQRGDEETLPKFDKKPRISSKGIIRRLEKDSGYAAHKANILLQSKQRRTAGRLALTSVAYAPWNILGWAAIFRTCKAFLPNRLSYELSNRHDCKG